MKSLFLISLLIIMIGCNCKNSEYLVNDDFLQDLSSENNRVWGELYLDVFNGNLDSLSLDYYLEYLDSTKHTSAEGIVGTINKANSILLETSEETFWLLLFYDRDGKIIADDASTDIGTVDSCIIYSNRHVSPDLNIYASEIIK